MVWVPSGDSELEWQVVQGKFVLVCILKVSSAQTLKA